MPRRAAILVSTGGSAAYSDSSLFTQILAQTGSNADEISLIIEDSLNRWNLLPVYGDDMEMALHKAVEDGDKWYGNFIKDVANYLGTKFKGTFRWEGWRQNSQINYEQKRKEFGNLCNKEKVIGILGSMIVTYKIVSKDDFLAKSDSLKKEKGLLLGGEKGKEWEELPWENAMAASVLEYSLRHFQSASTDPATQQKSNFADFLVTQFFPNAYEHQAEESVILYCCLIPANIKFDVLYYPNKISPIFQKAHVEFAKPENLMFWNELKVDSKKEDDIERVIRMYFAGVQGMSKGDKEMLANLIRPLLAFVETHKQQNQKATLLMTLSGLFSVYPQFIANTKKECAPTLFANTEPQKTQDSSKSLYDLELSITPVATHENDADTKEEYRTTISPS